MELFEYEATEVVEREAAARRLREIADQLEHHNEVRVRPGGLPITVKVPKQVTFEIEIEIEDDECEIELAIRW
jgi:amphi-Trp domain-containing protein